jgi:hypothetical protein
MKLFRKKELWFPTFTGWLLLLGVAAGFLFLTLAGLYPYLAKSKPVTANVLVVEGWLQDAEIPQVLALFDAGGYQKLIATGGDITFARELMPYSSYAETTYHRLLSAGLLTNQLDWVGGGEVVRDRTYHSALALRNRLNGECAAVNLVSIGPHSRRSQRLFQIALGDECEVGILSIEPQAFNQRNWWKCSDGFRTVINEAVAWFYARWIFEPEPEKDE